jgi:RNA polymerase subunit RPABC4/transcription elongation factor Spt4
MSIKVTCPRGHVLKVKNSMAGKTGLCPFCKDPVYVPPPEKPKTFSEDNILDIIGEMPPSPSQVGGSGIDLDEFRPHRPDKSHRETPWKTCVKCNRDIPSQSHICPYCHTYIAEIADF